MTQLSRPDVTVPAASTTVRLASGLAWSLNRDERVEPHTSGTEAWIPHLVVLAVVVTWFGIASRRSPWGWKVILAPLGRPIAGRIAATFRAGARPLNLVRCLIVSFLVFVEAY